MSSTTFDRLRELFHRAVRLGVEPGLAQPEVRTTVFTNTTVLIVLGYLVANMATTAIYGFWWLIGVQAAHGALVALSLRLSAQGRRHLAAVWFSLVAIGFVTFYALAYGPGSANHYFLAMIAFLQFFEFTATHRRTIVLLVALSAAAYATAWLGFDEPLVHLPDAFVDLQLRLAQAGMIGLSILFGAYAWITIRDAESSFERERERSDRLLLNVLPDSIAARLKAGEEPIADQFDDVTVLFADVVGFTPMSAQLEPAASVRILNDVFRAFDEICVRHGVEKIRTIGDGYMVAAGAPTPRPDHAATLARVALEMLAHIRSHAIGLAIRIGINSGAAVGGIVGTTKFHYDLWGDSVNVAARMESHGEPGRIQVGESTFRALGEAFECEPRGPISVKGKGELHTWWLLGEATVPGGSP